MCGIAGYVGVHHPSELQVISKTLQRGIQYRGRDGHGEWKCSSGQANLFHSRLSIIDHETGQQPMVDCSTRYVIVFNGEIYNYLELRKAYEAAGARFKTKSDTEVILEGFKLKGEAVCKDLNGMFAFAIWDIKNQKLFVARDRLGKKPLYWYSKNGIFYFSSSLLSFQSIPGWTGELSRTTLDFYSAVGSFPKKLTAYKDAFSLPPGHSAFVTSDRPPVVSCYWRLSFANKASISKARALEEYEDILTDSIRLRLRADVPIALTFSGGVDSGTIAAIAAHRLNSPLKCFTIDYHTDDSPSAETHIASETAKNFGLPWRFLQFDYHKELFPALNDILQVIDQPCNNLVVSYSAQLYKSIHPFAKVVLSGNGADELFLGYDGNEALYARDIRGITHLPKRLRFLANTLPQRNTSAESLANYQCSYVKTLLGDYHDDHSSDELINVLWNDIVEAEVHSYADLYTYMALSYYTCDGNFRLPDIAGLNAQVEVRSPFLDYRMVEFAAQLPTKFKVGNLFNPSQNKLLPKLFYEQHVPSSVAWAQKKGMGWNIRYGDSLAFDEMFQREFRSALTHICKAGLDASRFEIALDRFVKDKKNGIQYPSSAGMAMSGLMLGSWLKAHSL